MPGPSAEDIERAFGGRVFGVIGQLGEGQGWGSGQGALQNLSLHFTVQGERVEVETETVHSPEQQALAQFHEQNALVRLALRELVPENGEEIARPPLPLTLTFQERAARLRVCGRVHDFKSYACSGRSIAWARVGDLRVTVELPTAFFDSQALELDDEAEYARSDEPVGAQ